MKRVVMPIGDRFWSKVDATGVCWLWTAHRDPNGYGRFRLDGAIRPAHRVAYELLVGPIPEGLTLDHLCRIRHCVNPDHLEPVSRRVNTLRGIGVSALRARQTHCQHGHEFTPENTYTWRRQRRCRTCRANYLQSKVS